MQRQNILSQIEEDISKFKEILSTEKNKIVLEEKIIDILGEIEAKVSQIIGDKNGRNILQKEEVFQRYLSFNKIESQYTSIDDFLDELISKLSQELTQRKTKLKFDLFERGSAQIDGNGNAKEKIEIKTSQKNKIFLRVLHKMGIDFADVKQFEETLSPERMRKIPYQIYHITTKNIQKTVLISDQIGQATFVYDTIISPEIFQIIEKGEEIEGNKAFKIIYNQKTYEKNLEITLSNKLTFEEKEVQIINEEEEKVDEEKIKLTKEQLFQTLWNYEGKSEQESYDYFMELSAKGIQELEIWGNKVKSLGTLSGIEIKGNISNSNGFQEWIGKAFAGKDIVKRAILTKELLFQTLWNYEGRSEQESYDYFMELSQKGIRDLEIGGNKIVSLRTLSGIPIEGTIFNPSIFQEWIGKMFEGKNIVKRATLTKELLFQTLWNYEGRSEQESYDYFMELSQKGIQDLEIGGNKITSLGTLSGIPIEGTIITQSGFHEWIGKVFAGKNIVKQTILIKELLFQTFWNYEGRSEQESYDYFMGLSAKGIQELEIGGNKITSLGTISGIPIEGNIQTPSVFQEWIGKVFEGKKVVKQANLTKELLFQTLWNYEGRNEQESYDYFMGLTQKGIGDLEIGGIKVKSLRTLSGIKIEGEIKTPSIFQEWIGKVFEGKNIVKRAILTKELLFQTLWNYEGRSEQESYDYFMELSQKGIQDLEIGGNKITSLGNFSGIPIEGSIQTSSVFQEWIGKVFEGKDIVKQSILTKELLFQTLWNYEGRSEQESYDYFMELSAKGILYLEIGRNKVRSLGRLSGIQIEGSIQTPSIFQEWIGKVFEGKNIVRKSKKQS